MVHRFIDLVLDRSSAPPQTLLSLTSGYHHCRAAEDVTYSSHFYFYTCSGAWFALINHFQHRSNLRSYGDGD